MDFFFVSFSYNLYTAFMFIYIIFSIKYYGYMCFVNK